MLKGVVPALVVACAGAVGAITDAVAQTPPAPQPVVVVNQTRFQPVAQDVTIASGQSQRFEVRSDGFARVSVLLAGSTTPGTGGLRIATSYGPPFVPGTGVRAMIDPAGMIRGRVLEPVLGPAMAIVVSNDSTADARISLSAYFAN